MAVADAGKETAYTFGVVPQYDARQIEAIWGPILAAIESRTGIKLKLVGSVDLRDYERAVAEGAYDFAFLNPYIVLKVQRTQKYIPLVRDIQQPLQGILVVKKDSPYQRVQDLAGKIVAFPAPNAVGASLLPRAELARTFHIRIQPHYVGSHDSVYLNVALGLAEAGGGVNRTLQAQPPEVRQQLRVLYTTQGIATHPVAAHPRVPAAVRARVTQAFLDLGDTEDGRALYAKIPMARIGVARIEDYQSMEHLDLDSLYTDPLKP
jgi:phosphonate transport system substrate-binding protein